MKFSYTQTLISASKAKSTKQVLTPADVFYGRLTSAKANIAYAQMVEANVASDLLQRAIVDLQMASAALALIA